MKNRVILLIIGMSLLIVTIIGASFAYFGISSVDSDDKLNINSTTANGTRFDLITVGNVVSMHVSGGDMMKNNIQDDAVSSNSASLSISLNSGTPESPMECEYDIYYVYESGNGTTNYVRTDNNQNEFTYKISNNGRSIVSETNFVNTTNVPQKVYTGIIKSNGTDRVNNFNVTANFYNIDGNQIANANGNWNIRFYIDASKERCEKATTFGYTGDIYRHNGYYVVDGTNILPSNGPKWIIGDDEEIYYYFDTQSQCENYLTLTAGYWDELPTCEYRNVEYPGIGDYETDLESMVTKEYHYYCALETNEECSWESTHFTSLEDCMEYANGRSVTCTYATLTAETVSYLKHYIEDDVLQSTEVCIYYNDKELCLDNDYYIDGDTDGMQTASKLENDLVDTFGRSVDWCDYQEGYVWCGIDNAWCIVESEDVRCEGDNYQCFSYSYGESWCEE